MSEQELPLNADQLKAIEICQGFLGSTSEKYMVLEGPGGTGKTFTIKRLVRTLDEYHKTRKILGLKGKTKLPVFFTATTNKACEALSSALEDLNAVVDTGSIPTMNPEVKTIHSFLGLTMMPHPEDPRKSILGDREPGKIISDCIIVIDEASYIDDDMMEWLELKLGKNVKVIFVGDPAQLKAANSTKMPAFFSGFRKASLTIVERFENDTVISDFSIELRKRILAEEWRIPPIPVDGKHIIRLDRLAYDQLMFKDMSHPDWMFSTSKFLAFRNKRIQEYNKGLNGAISGTRSFQKGDYAVNNHYVSGTKKSGNIGTDRMVFIDAMERNIRFDIEGYDMYLDGNDDRVFFLPDDHTAIIKVQRKFFKAYEKDPDSASGALAIKNLNSVKDTWVDLRPVYAQTIYKSQGSTFRRVYIDLADIGFCGDTETKMRMLYVACTRARKQLFITGDL
jgi:ATP-dependent exoDNAse (exonuclease V) alpha subunit